MKVAAKKLYCFADESGQDTGGKIFLVAVVLEGSEMVDRLRQSMEEVEHMSDKHSRKWTKTPNSVKRKFLDLLLESNQLRGLCFYSAYHDSKDYTPLMALTIAKSISAFTQSNCSVSVVIDGLQDAEAESVRRQLKNLKIHYSMIRGMKDEQDALVRLADSVAGFVRDYLEGQSYAQKIFGEFSRRNINAELSMARPPNIRKRLAVPILLAVKLTDTHQKAVFGQISSFRQKSIFEDYHIGKECQEYFLMLHVYNGVNGNARAKIYCYVDETGQGTKGELFLVSVVIVDADRDDLELRLLSIERESGKGLGKWSRTNTKRRLKYLQLVMADSAFSCKNFFRTVPQDP